MESEWNLDRLNECLGFSTALHVTIKGIEDIPGRLRDDEAGHKAGCISTQEHCRAAILRVDTYNFHFVYLHILLLQNVFKHKRATGFGAFSANVLPLHM